MKIVKKHDEAVELIKKNIENTMSIEVTSTGKELILLGCLEGRTDDLEYPEDMVHYMYGMGSGWTVSLQHFLNENEGDTLIDKLVSEQGIHCGDIALNSTECIETYADTDMTYIIGTDNEIQDMIPHLAEGKYCFIFVSEYDYEKHIHSEVEHRNLLHDASRAVAAFAKSPGLTEYEHKYIKSHINDLVDIFRNRRSVKHPVAETWQEAIYALCRKSHEDENKLWISQDYYMDVSATFSEGDDQYFMYSIYDKSGKRIVVSYDSIESNAIDSTDPMQEMQTYAEYVKTDLDHILSKPMLCKCSYLMKAAYLCVEASDSGYFKLNEGDAGITDKDIIQLKEEVQKLKLDNVFWFDEPGVVVASYSDLLCRFNSIGVN